MKSRWTMLLIAASSFFAAMPAAAQELLWRHAVGGSIGGYPAQGPGGDVYIIAEDRALHSLNPLTGDQNWIYRPGGRLRNLLLAAPDGTIYIQNDRHELFAVTPGGSGRWKMNMRSEPAALPGAAPDGRLILPLAGGRIVCVSRRGVILWKRDESAEASAGPVLTGDGTAWIPLTDGRLLALDALGECIAEYNFGSAVSILALDGLERIWAGGFNGRLVVLEAPSARSISHRAASSGTSDSGELGGPGGPAGQVFPAGVKIAFEGRPGTGRVAALLADEEGGGSVFLADGKLVEYDSAGNVRGERRIAVSGGAPSASSDDGTLFVPAADGSIRVIPPEKKIAGGRGIDSGGEAIGGDAGGGEAAGGGWNGLSGGDIPIGDGIEHEGVLRGKSVLAEPLLTKEGVLIAGGGDWILYAWNAGAPGGAWMQFRGGPRRSGSLSADTPKMSREEARRDPGFFYRELMAVSDDAEERLDLIRELERYSEDFSMKKDLPWADLLLEDLVSVGTVRHVGLSNQPLESHSVVRSRSYTLLGASEDFRSRKLILDCLAFEEDPAALASGFRALGRIGVDWDGASMRLMSERYLRMMPADDRLAVQTARAFSDLVRYNGRISDSAGYSLMDALLRSEISASARAAVISAVREVMGF